ncbi:hypothetical protein LSH36_107g05000 [Paralvinella palmiformis]|uniref:Methyltransferase FkbM domain-containing protein n=1 Tax=Paralvinella palmiformis TaxID=53620 RepID=A0AAD9NC99_9ANNE|nr:hypothetical protein LSH36_107g05000 [Paralvinella palmiformis]
MADAKLLLTSLTLFLMLVVLALEFSDYARPPKTGNILYSAPTGFDPSEENMSCSDGIDSLEEWRLPLTPDWLQDLAQDDPELVRHVCAEWLLPPSTGERRLLQPEREHYSQRGQSEFVDELLNHKTNGFFVEGGAFNGEELSNSLFFEKSRNWTGLLVEPNPSSFLSLLEKRRRAYMVNACLSPNTKPAILPFHLVRNYRGIIRLHGTDPQEGAELEILFTLPLNQITVDVFSIEYVVTNNQQASDRKLEIIKKYLVDSHGYRIVQIGEGEDVILKKF